LGAGWANAATWAVSLLLLVLGVGLFLASPSGREVAGDAGAHATRRANDVDLAIAILLMLLLPSLYWDHYAVLALLPLYLLTRSRPGVCGVFFLAAGAAFLAIPQGFFHSISSGVGAGVLLYSMGLWGTLAMLGVGAVMRARLARNFRMASRAEPEAAPVTGWPRP
jgi:hypothetical protein